MYKKKIELWILLGSIDYWKRFKWKQLNINYKKKIIHRLT